MSEKIAQFEQIQPIKNDWIESKKHQISSKEKEQGVFDQILELVKQVNHTELEANKAATDYQTGQPVEIHDVMIKQEKAMLTMELLMQVRNKTLDGFREIYNMQV